MASKRSGSKSKAAPDKTASKKAPATKRVTQQEAVSGVISPALQELIGHALTDGNFRKLLFADRAKAIKSYKLTKLDLEALAQLKEEQLEQQGVAMAKKLNVKIFVQITIHF